MGLAHIIKPVWCSPYFLPADNDVAMLNISGCGLLSAFSQGNAVVHFCCRTVASCSISPWREHLERTLILMPRCTLITLTTGMDVKGSFIVEHTVWLWMFFSFFSSLLSWITDDKYDECWECHYSVIIYTSSRCSKPVWLVSAPGNWVMSFHPFLS